MADGTLTAAALGRLLDDGDLGGLEVLEDDRLGDGDGDAAERLASARIVVRADLLWPDERPLAAAWLGPAGGLFALPDEGDAVVLAEGPGWRIPHLLGAALHLGPRPRSEHDGVLVTTPDNLHALLGLGTRADPRGVAEALELDAPPSADEAAPLLALAAVRPAHVRVSAEWDGGRRALHLLDRMEAPLWLLAERPDGSLAGGPSTPTVLWRGLSALLPRDDDLTGPSAETGLPGAMRQ